MNQKHIIEFAIKGIVADIRKLERMVRKGQGHLEDLRNGKPIKSSNSYDEILEIVRNAQAEIEELVSKKFDLEWELATNEELN